MSRRLVWAIVRARAPLLAGVAGVCLLAALGYGLLASDRYQAVATLFVDPSALGVDAGANATGLHATDLDLLRSERVAQRVVENEHLVEEPQLHGLYLASIDAGRPPLEALARAIAAQVEAQAGGDGALVRLTVTAGEPQLAARIANAYAQAWGEVGLELRAASIRNGIERAHQDLVALRARLGEAQARNRDDRGLGATDERANEQFAQLSRLATRPLRHVGTPAAESAAGTVVRPDLAAVGEGTADPAAALTESALRSADITSAADAAAAGTGASGLAIGSVSGSATSLATGLTAARAGSAALVTGASVSTAADEIRLAQQSLERAEERLVRLSAEGIGAPFPVHVLLAARVPEVSSKPGLAVCAAVGLSLGLLLGLLAMGIAEAVDRRVRRASDLARGLGIVVLGNLPSTRVRTVPAQRGSVAGRWLPPWPRAGGAV